MKKTLSTFLLTLFFSLSLVAGENFSEMSTQELISIMGYVKPSERKKFRAELESRKPHMNKAERRAYERNKAKKKR